MTFYDLGFDYPCIELTYFREKKFESKQSQQRPKLYILWTDVALLAVRNGQRENIVFKA